MLSKPTVESYGHSQGKEQSRATIEMPSEHEPVISSQKNQQKHKRAARRERTPQAANNRNSKRDRHIKAQVHGRRNPQNLSRNVHHARPLRPVDALKDQQTESFSNSPNNPETNCCR